MLSLKLAWRNIWRNRRRTIITTLSIVVAVFLSIFARSTQEGQYDNMIRNTVGSFTGYIQVHQQGYWDDQTLNNSFAHTDSLSDAILSDPAVTRLIPRIDSYALAATGEQSRPAMVMGIDVEAERHLSRPHTRLESGSYFESNSEQAVLVGHELLDRLNAEVGDSLVLIGQGYHGMNATGLYPIRGSISFPNPELNSSLVYLPLQTAQIFFSADGRLTTAALLLEDARHTGETADRLREQLPSDRYEVMAWQEMSPELEQAIRADRGSGVIVLMILYMVVGFGILGTVLMMIAERSYEFGVMLSVGTPRIVLGKILAIEILLMAMMGAGIGILLGIPVVWYLNRNPIELGGRMAETMEQYAMQPVLEFSTDAMIFIQQGWVVFLITLLFCIIPIIRAMRLNPVEAMKH